MAYRHELDFQLRDAVTFHNQNSLNLIIDERIKYDREYIILNQLHVKEGIDNPSNLLNIFTDQEFKIFFKQALEMEYISKYKYKKLLLDKTKIYDYILMNEIQQLLLKNYLYKMQTPDIIDLEKNGLLDSIIKVINENPELIVNEPTVINYTDEYLYHLMQIHRFISFKKAELILDSPKDIIHILEHDEMLSLLHRLKPYIDFLGDTEIAAVQSLIDKHSKDIEQIFSVNEIKILIDKEIELKYLILRALTPEKIEEMFEKFKDELIGIQIGDMVTNMFDVLKNEIFGKNYDGLIVSQVQNYMTSNYNSMMKSAIDKSFNKFKTEFIAVDLKTIIEGYFNTLKADLFSNNYDAVIKDLVQNFLDVNFPSVTRSQVLQWIIEENAKK